MSIIGLYQSYGMSDSSPAHRSFGQVIADLIAPLFARFAKEAPLPPTAIPASETAPLLAEPEKVYKALDCEYRVVDAEVIMKQREMFIQHPDFCRRRFMLQHNHLPYYVKRIDVRPSDFSSNTHNCYGISNYRAEILVSNRG
jgi:hypothetical protein